MSSCWAGSTSARCRSGTGSRCSRRTRPSDPAPRVTELAPDPLIGVAELAATAGRPGPGAVCDTRWYLGAPERGRTEYASERIPGARFVDLDTDLADHQHRWVEVAIRCPIRSSSRHVWPSWVSGRRPRSSPTTTARVCRHPGCGGCSTRWAIAPCGCSTAASRRGARRAGRSERAGRGPDSPAPRRPCRWPPPGRGPSNGTSCGTGLDELTLLDVRAGERYRGEVEPVDPKPGHIPGAISAPSAANVGADGLLRPPDELAARFVDLGAADGEVVVSCGSGVTACHTALAMRVAGLPDPLLYAGSYSDWVGRGLPVVIGSEPGRAAAASLLGYDAQPHDHPRADVLSDVSPGRAGDHGRARREVVGALLIQVPGSRRERRAGPQGHGSATTDPEVPPCPSDRPSMVSARSCTRRARSHVVGRPRSHVDRARLAHARHTRHLRNTSTCTPPPPTAGRGSPAGPPASPPPRSSSRRPSSPSRRPPARPSHRPHPSTRRRSRSPSSAS